MEKENTIWNVVGILKKRLPKEYGINIVKIISTSFSIKRTHLEKDNIDITIYSFKFNKDKYSNFSHNYNSPDIFLEEFYNKKLDFEEIIFPPSDTSHQFIILKINENRFYLVLGYGNGKYIKAYELNKKKFLDFIEKIAIKNLNDWKQSYKKSQEFYKDYFKKYPDAYNVYNRKYEIAKKVPTLIRKLSKI